MSKVGTLRIVKKRGEIDEVSVRTRHFKLGKMWFRITELSLGPMADIIRLKKGQKVMFTYIPQHGKGYHMNWVHQIKLDDKQYRTRETQFELIVGG